MYKIKKLLSFSSILLSLLSSKRKKEEKQLKMWRIAKAKGGEDI